MTVLDAQRIHLAWGWVKTLLWILGSAQRTGRGEQALREARKEKVT